LISNVIKIRIKQPTKECVNAVKTSENSLIVIINDILDLAKVNAGKMNFEENPLNLKPNNYEILISREM
jgi:two-component system CheB/CheR fusion protein